jgi:uncharacterized protein YqjF (DUF2071 family)
MSRPFLTARWENLVMLNFEIDPELLKAYVPAGVQLDTFQDRHFISIVGFQFRDVRIRGLAIPWHREFEEVNLRFYVRRHGHDGVRRGVVFLSEVVRLRAVAAIANWRYNERYVVAPTSCQLRWPHHDVPGRFEYRWGAVSAGAEFAGDSQLPAPNSLEEFITEHYWGYAMQRDGGTMEYAVEHRPWRVWSARSSWLEGDLAKFYPPEFATYLLRPAASALVAEGSPVVVHRGQRLPVVSPIGGVQ